MARFGLRGVLSPARPSVRLLAVSLLLIVNGSCHKETRFVPLSCVSAAPAAAATWPSAGPSASGVDKFLPPYRRILECTGWLAYVDQNIDVVRYYDLETFQSSQGPAIGLARYESGLRIADIAIKDQTDINVVGVIVHEAAHLSGIRQMGTYLDQEAATGVQRRFLADARIRSGGALGIRSR